MLSSLVMILLGRVCEGLIVDVQASNKKLIGSILLPSLRRSTKPSRRQSTTTWSCPPNATYWSASTAEITAKSLEVLRQAAALVDAKAPADATAFKIWLCHISQAVAEASTEGGFFSFGGVRVSDAEKATLAQISAILGVAGYWPVRGWQLSSRVSNADNALWAVVLRWAIDRPDVLLVSHYLPGRLPL